MAVENVLRPEENIIESNEFYLFYEMMMQSLKVDNVMSGINCSLDILRKYLKSGNIALFRKNENGVYVFKISDSEMTDLTKSIGCIVNKTHPLVEQKEIFNINLNLSERLNNMMLLHIGIENNREECIMAILNIDNSKALEPQFWIRVKETMQVILKRAASYEKNITAITTDLLTGLDNRNSYEIRLQSINEEDDNLVLAIFDLFRLKHINDNYTHAKGDNYIKAAATILSKYWPKQKVKVNDDGTEVSINTGHCVYRVGGDEFVLLTNVENLQLAEIKASLAQQESNMIDLGINNKIQLGLNCGIVRHNPGDSIKQTFIRADELMQEDKSEMYKKFNLERRRN